MNRFRWWLLLSLVFVAVFGTVLWWPVSPMWTQEVRSRWSGGIMGYIHDGKSVMVCESMSVSHDLDLTIYDVETGRLIQRKTMTFEKDWRNYGIKLLPDGKHFFCGEQYVDPTTYKVQDDYDGSVVRPRRYQILEVDTHRVVAGPFIYTNDRLMTFSPDGRWFWSANPSPGYGHDVIETMTGKTVISKREQPDQRLFHLCAFAPDSSAIAIEWYGAKTKRYEIEVLDLPSGKTRFSYLLPMDIRFTWSLLDQWKNDRLYIGANQVWRASKAYKTLCLSFPVHADKLGEMREEPQLEGYFEHRNEPYSASRRYFEKGNRLIQVSKGKLDDTPDWLNEFLAWFEKKFGVSFMMPSRSSTRLSFFDRDTGRLLYSFGSPHLRLWQDEVSPNGRRVGSFDTVAGLFMWDADPFPRWPLAGGLGLLAVGVLVGIRYFGRCRAALVARG